jgi:hypothetical protein
LNEQTGAEGCIAARLKRRIPAIVQQIGRGMMKKTAALPEGERETPSGTQSAGSFGIAGRAIQLEVRA